MPGSTIKVRSSGGGEFDCYLNVPHTGKQVPAVVLASAVHGVDADLIAIADEFTAHGFIAAAPDLFWRTLPGPLSMTTAAPSSVPSRASRRLNRARPTWPIHWRGSANCPNSTEAP
jgi:dienelactone hydrolase